MYIRHTLLSSIALLLLTACGHNNDVDNTQQALSKEQLGQQLFFDTNLSSNRTQSCATCHAPSHAFVDPRDNGVNGAYSLGDDGHSLGDRNAPTAAYAMFSPERKKKKKKGKKKKKKRGKEKEKRKKERKRKKQ
eukprot:gnl/Carplike_NY0171/15889_a23918_152.p1 GENE.gnl/Carplike_NY0171/15889_a23918_152~~gnl/Carplike_NY0171/15889_a23918_152.p1  ORF type:complete len:134 (-),score=4.95 gnl/Carplike_NY0171/15889_a23918_152:18-419(-)